jgi:hypothetical protein
MRRNKMKWFIVFQDIAQSYPKRWFFTSETIIEAINYFTKDWMRDYNVPNLIWAHLIMEDTGDIYATLPANPNIAEKLIRDISALSYNQLMAIWRDPDTLGNIPYSLKQGIRETVDTRLTEEFKKDYNKILNT